LRILAERAGAFYNMARCGRRAAAHARLHLPSPLKHSSGAGWRTGRARAVRCAGALSGGACGRIFLFGCGSVSTSLHSTTAWQSGRTRQPAWKNLLHLASAIPRKHITRRWFFKACCCGTARVWGVNSVECACVAPVTARREGCVEGSFSASAALCLACTIPFAWPVFLLRVALLLPGKNTILSTQLVAFFLQRLGGDCFNTI